MVPVQISTSMEGKAYTATLRCVVNGKEHVSETKGMGDKTDSRQRLELLAVVSALERMNNRTTYITIKGSGYIKTGFEYLQVWEAAGWKKTNGKPVANADLWQKAAEAARIHRITIFLT